jgi:hypothetical protein
MQQYSCNNTHATILMQQYLCIDTHASILIHRNRRSTHEIPIRVWRSKKRAKHGQEDDAGGRMGPCLYYQTHSSCDWEFRVWHDGCCAIDLTQALKQNKKWFGFLYVCMYVCMYICMYVLTRRIRPVMCMYVYMNVCIYVWIRCIGPVIENSVPGMRHDGCCAIHFTQALKN